jgi:hypothetical protein
MTTTTIETDAEELAKRFTLSELRHEAHLADISAHPDWDDFPYWNWYRDTVNEAIAIKRQNQPKPKPIAGHIDAESIKARADILTIIESYGFKPRKAGHNFKLCCPFHNEKTPSFIVNPDKQSWHCFGACATGGDVFSFVMKIDNCDFKAAAVKVSEMR